MPTDGYPSCEGLVATVSDGVLRLVVDRPEKRNSLTDDIVAAMTECVSTAGRDESVRAILLTGAGEHFCSGFDIVARNEDRSRRPRVGSIQRRVPALAHRLIPLLASVQTPVVVVARGWVAGIGLHLLLAADFALVAEDARLWEPFSERGFTPDSGATWLLPRRVGDVRAREILLLGRVLSGTEAAQWGMVHAAVPGPELDRAGEELLSTPGLRADRDARLHQVAAPRLRGVPVRPPAGARGARPRALVAQRGLSRGPRRVQGEAATPLHGPLNRL